MKFIAIWEVERNQVLLYGSTGERILKTQILRPLGMDLVAA